MALQAGQGEGGGVSPQRRQWLHDLEHEAAALAPWQERARLGKLNSADKAAMRQWSREFKQKVAELDRR